MNRNAEAVARAYLDADFVTDTIGALPTIEWLEIPDGRHPVDPPLLRSAAVAARARRGRAPRTAAVNG